MIFTLGNTESYYQGLKEATKSSPLKKMGRRNDFPGGSVWKTYQEAEAHLTTGFSIFGVDADWETDTVPNEENCSWNDLLIDAKIIDLKEYDEDWLRNYNI